MGRKTLTRLTLQPTATALESRVRSPPKTSFCRRSKFRKPKRVPFWGGLFQFVDFIGARMSKMVAITPLFLGMTIRVA
ncbi:uncharacterized protein EI90DRAFT_3049618 [Cantharellus anzutake]|uniref:uncharacterized protein n=1 Tax=Cantharellus anzutake TaxID=1750568 RepID=UPI001903D45B|nr:uncharacterized protein EI90DRAFT_3049618 [Cantharellus anzutake]KAF8334634.1 hypothetical protein EI90DRAFT_3049618 [Cantharellus anzutake]